MICKYPVPLIGEGGGGGEGKGRGRGGGGGEGRGRRGGEGIRGGGLYVFLISRSGFTFHSGCSFPRFVISFKFIGPRYPYLHSVHYFWVCKSSGIITYMHGLSTVVQ